MLACPFTRAQAVVDHRVEAIDDRLRSASRRQHAIPVEADDAGHAGLRHGWQIEHLGMALLARHHKRARSLPAWMKD
jgi:hypothetical protein